MYVSLLVVKPVMKLLPDVNSANVSVLKSSIQDNRYDYSLALISVNLSGDSGETCASSEAELEGDPSSCAFNKYQKALLVDGRHRFCALQDMALEHRWNVDQLLRVFSEFKKKPSIDAAKTHFAKLYAQQIFMQFSHQSALREPCPNHTVL